MENAPSGLAVEYSRSGDYQEECNRVKKDIQNFIDRKYIYPDKTIYKLIGKFDKKPSQNLNNWKEIPESVKK